MAPEASLSQANPAPGWEGAGDAGWERREQSSSPAVLGKFGKTEACLWDPSETLSPVHIALTLTQSLENTASQEILCAPDTATSPLLTLLLPQSFFFVFFFFKSFSCDTHLNQRLNRKAVQLSQFMVMCVNDRVQEACSSDNTLPMGKLDWIFCQTNQFGGMRKKDIQSRNTSIREISFAQELVHIFM